jgi:hypothetical protein
MIEAALQEVCGPLHYRVRVRYCFAACAYEHQRVLCAVAFYGQGPVVLLIPQQCDVQVGKPANRPSKIR